MASRKDKKEALRREREERERAAKAAERRKRIVGIGVGGAIALAAVVGIVLLITAGGGNGGDAPGGVDPSGDDLPSGGSVPRQREGDLRQAAQAADCVTKDFPGQSREHLGPGAGAPRYTSEPPTSGPHDQVPAEDGAYAEAPPKPNLVHTLEHGRVVVWYKPSLPEQQIANLKALFDEDQYQLVLVPNSDMNVDVAASAWQAEPEPNGTGRLLECRRYNERIFDALRAFREEYRGRGPEPVP